MDMPHSGPNGLCPCCERFIGPVGTCPYCGEDAAENRSVRILRWASVILAFTGLAFVYAAARGAEIPRVEIAEITPMMNFARIRVTGTVTRQPYVARENSKVDYLSFTINDAGGRIRVAARGEVALALVEKKRLPTPGCDVEVTGNLRVSNQGEARLYLQSPDHLLVRKHQP